MAYTQPQFALPFVVDGTVTVAFDTGADVVVSVGSSTTVKFNDRSDAHSGHDAVDFVVDAIDTADTGGTWAYAEVAGDFKGRTKWTRTASDGRNLSAITFSGGLTGRMFGFTDDSPSLADGQIVANVATGTWIRQYLWIPQPASQILLAEEEKTRVDAVVSTSSPDGTTTRDYYGGADRRRIVIYSIPAAGIWQFYADQAGYSANQGNTAGDLNCAFDSFRQLWRGDLPTSDAAKLYCRFAPDLTSPLTSVQINPGAGDTWIGDLSQALEVESRSPYRFALTLDVFEVD